MYHGLRELRHGCMLRDGLEIDPCLPKELLPAKVTRVFRGKKYNITITKNEKIFIKDDDKNVNVVI